MKKILVMICIGVLTLGMAGCGNKNNSQNGQGSQSTAQNTAGTQESTGNQGALGSQEGAGNQGALGSQEGAGNQEVSEGWSEDMLRIKDAVVDALGEDYWPNTEIIPEMLEANYGISPEMYDDYLAECPLISTNVDTLIVVKAKDGKIDAVEEALESYRDRMVSDTMQYPANIGKIHASRIERIGNYICFVQLGADTMELLDQGDEAVIEHCQDKNELVLEVIRGVVSE